jgi:hypothetical protein
MILRNHKSLIFLVIIGHGPGLLNDFPKILTIKIFENLIWSSLMMNFLPIF